MANVILGNKRSYVNQSYRTGSNSLWDKPKHSLIIDAQGASNKTIQTESGSLRFENGVAALPDDSRAKDIYDEIQKTQALHPNQYSLVQDKHTINTDTVHRYFFGSLPPMPWATYDELGRRIKDPEIEENESGKSDESGNSVTEHRTGQL